MFQLLLRYADYEVLLEKMMIPFFPLYNAEQSSFKIREEVSTNYSIKEARFENFSRSLLGLSFIDNNAVIDISLQMIKNGVNSNSPLYWGKIEDNSQIIVELFPILFFCLQNKSRFYSCFTNKDRNSFQEWFYQINYVKVFDNNWHFFPILVNTFLKELDLEYSEDVILKSWEIIDSYYLGNGWYSDGNTNQRDYYIAFAFHFYSLLYAYYTSDHERRSIILDRAKDFAQSFIYFFSENGETVPFGRSLTYKFAQVSFFSIYTNFIKSEEELGILKGLVNRNLRWWLTKEIFDEKGFLVNGYAYANPYMLEQYNGTGSSYWALKAFFCMLNPKSKFFDIEEAPMPSLESSKEIPEAFVSIRRTKGNTCLFMNGQSNIWFCGATEKYEKFVYSSLFGFNISRSHTNLSSIAPDSTLIACVGKSTFVRSGAKIIHNDSNVQISEWNPISSMVVRSFVFMGTPWHIRVHYVISDEYLELKDFGFAYNNESKHTYSEIYSTNLSVASYLLDCDPNTNVLYPRVSVPYLSAIFSAGENLLISCVYGDSKPCIEYPDTSSIFIKDHRLFAFGKSYDLPRKSLLDCLRKCCYQFKYWK